MHHMFELTDRMNDMCPTRIQVHCGNMGDVCNEGVINWITNMHEHIADDGTDNGMCP